MLDATLLQHKQQKTDDSGGLPEAASAVGPFEAFTVATGVKERVHRPRPLKLVPEVFPVRRMEGAYNQRPPNERRGSSPGLRSAAEELSRELGISFDPWSPLPAAAERNASGDVPNGPTIDTALANRRGATLHLGDLDYWMMDEMYIVRCPPLGSPFSLSINLAFTVFSRDA